MNLGTIKGAYRRYARFYDLLFGPVFQPGRRRVVDALGCRTGERLLEVGVGTGLSLPLYPEGVEVTGIDISAEMLARAHEKVRRYRLNHVTALEEMDAEAMAFADDTFDKVVAMYVVSVTPEPRRLVAEMQRVCKPGGELFIVNHFRSEQPLMAALERACAPLSQLAGFRPDMATNEVVDACRLDVVDVSCANVLGYWRVLRCRNGASAPLHSPA